MGAELNFDLTQFHTNPSDFHLMINPSDELYLPISQVPYQVPCTISPRSGFCSDLVAHESLSVHHRPPQIPTTPPLPAQTHSTRHSYRYDSQFTINNIATGIGDRPTYRNDALP